MKVGDKVIIKRKRKVGKGYSSRLREQKATVIQICKNFIVVQHEKGYRECFSQEDLKMEEKNA